MEHLSSKVLDLLAWLSQGHSLSLCTSPGRALGDIKSSTGYLTKGTRAALYTLITYGFVEEAEEFHLGIRCSRFHVSDKGLKRVKE